MTDTPFGDDSRLTDTQRAFVRGYCAAIRDLDNERASIEDGIAIGNGTILVRMVAEIEHNCLTRMIDGMTVEIDRISGDFAKINDTEED